MASPPEVPSSEAIAGHYQQSLERRRRGVRLIWGILIGFGLLLLFSPVILYMAWNARGRSLLRAQLAEIKAAGQPITTAEMQEYYKVPEGTPDITDMWVAAIAPFDTPQFNQSAKALPILGIGTQPPPLDQPLPAEDDQAIRDWLQAHQSLLAAVYAAACTPGEVRYPRDFRKGIGMLLPEAQQIRSVVRALDLEFEILARQDDLEAALGNLETSFIAGETLRHEPIIISMLVRIAVQGVVLNNIRELAATNRLSDEQLARLQTLARKIDVHGQMDDAMLGERAMSYHAFHLNVGLAPDPNNLQADARETSHDVRHVKRPEDAAMAMKLLTQMHNAAEQPMPGFLHATDQFDAELNQLKADGSPITRLRYVMTMMLLPAISGAGAADARGEAWRDLTDAALAVQRYHLKHQKPPETLADLVPDFLPQVPSDPFDGQLLRLLTKEDMLVIYSVGEDRRDDGGQTDPRTHKPDIAVEIEFPAAE
jgi:hypothetical protein